MRRQGCRRKSAAHEVVAALSNVAEAIDQLSGVTISVSAAIEQQRDATEHFAASARESSAAVSDVAGRMAGIADMVQRSRTTAQDVSSLAAAMQSTSQILCHEIPDIVQRAVKADLREFPRYEVKLTARLERHAGAIDVAVLDISEGGARIDAPRSHDLLAGGQVPGHLHQAGGGIKDPDRHRPQPPRPTRPGTSTAYPPEDWASSALTGTASTLLTL